jgi:hypothetical protein
MNFTETKCAIICAGIGNWYPKGVDRLERSLIFHGSAADHLFWRELPQGWPTHDYNPYAFKVYAFKEAFAKGYKNVLWLDASFWAAGNPNKIFDYIQDNGLYFFDSGLPLAYTATDRLLYQTGYDPERREDFLKVKDWATGAIGINIDNPKGQQYFNTWSMYCDIGLFNGSRTYNPQDSKHPLFRFSRQDQAASSMVLHKMGITEIPAPEWISYYGPNFNKADLIFFIQGL